MSPLVHLVGFGLRQVIGDYADGVGQVVAAVEQHFRDHSRKLPKRWTRPTSGPGKPSASLWPATACSTA